MTTDTAIVSKTLRRAGWAALALSWGLAPACSPTRPPAGDAARDVSPGAVRLAQFEAPIRGCDRVEFHLDVRGDTHVPALGAAAFSFELAEAPEAIDAQAGTRRAVENTCFSEESRDGGLGYYRACFGGLAAGTGYYVWAHVALTSGPIQESFYFSTPPVAACTADSNDAAVDAVVGTDVPSDTAPDGAPVATDADEPVDASSD